MDSTYGQFTVTEVSVPGRYRGKVVVAVLCVLPILGVLCLSIVIDDNVTKEEMKLGVGAIMTLIILVLIYLWRVIEAFDAAFKREVAAELVGFGLHNAQIQTGGFHYMDLDTFEAWTDAGERVEGVIISVAPYTYAWELIS